MDPHQRGLDLTPDPPINTVALNDVMLQKALWAFLLPWIEGLAARVTAARLGPC